VNLTRLCRLATLLTIPILLGTASAQHEQHFNFSGANGSGPLGGLVIDSLGNFYGSTYEGGTSGTGVVYEISPTPNGGASETVLHDFSDKNGDGYNPWGDLTLDTVGNLYGTTQYGGALNQGTVFKLSPPSSPGAPWTEAVLHSFQGATSDGAQPVAGLVLDSAGNLYGTTSVGGINGDCDFGGCGVVFELSPPAAPGGAWTETMLYFFQGDGANDGSNPLAGLVFDQTGNLYGTTSTGGPDNAGGTIFELSPPSEQGGTWSEAILHSFLGEGGGGPKAGVTFSPNGALFGTTYYGGAVYRLQPPSRPGGDWSYAEIYHAPNFVGISAGITIGNPHTLYGMYTSNGEGYVFQITDSDGTVTVTAFPVSGSYPAATMIIHNGALYGTTANGGYKNNGTAFRLQP
jgi:uncharacterized repeat protein (TIGR03803 family)